MKKEFQEELEIIICKLEYILRNNYDLLEMTEEQKNRLDYIMQKSYVN